MNLPHIKIYTCKACSKIFISREIKTDASVYQVRFIVQTFLDLMMNRFDPVQDSKEEYCVIIFSLISILDFMCLLWPHYRACLNATGIQVAENPHEDLFKTYPVLLRDTEGPINVLVETQTANSSIYHNSRLDTRSPQCTQLSYLFWLYLALLMLTEHGWEAPELS